jgi:hypothetical protein
MRRSAKRIIGIAGNDRRLRAYPEPAGRDRLYLVIGEVHNPKRAEPVANPRWLAIPERGLYTGIAIFGAIGSGKTSGCMYPFYNHKYAKSHFVDVQTLSKETYRPERFPSFPGEERFPRTQADGTNPKTRGKNGERRLSQSEHDWAYAKRALALGESVNDVISTLAALRTDKHDPQYYAELTVRKAAAALTAENSRTIDR